MSAADTPHTITPAGQPDQSHQQQKDARYLATLEPMATEGLSRSAQRDLSGARQRFPASIDLVRAGITKHQQTAMQHMSIFGMQAKVSVRLNRGVLLPVDVGGTPILKPIPSTPLTLGGDVPANEALTMLLAGVARKKLEIFIALRSPGAARQHVLFATPT